MNLRKEDGFSLTELTIVIAVIAVLAAFAGASYNGSRKNSQDSVVKANLEKSANSLNRLLINLNATPESLIAGSLAFSQIVTQMNDFEKGLTVTEIGSACLVRGVAYINGKQIYLSTKPEESSLSNRNFLLAAKSQSGNIYTITVSRSGVGDPQLYTPPQPPTPC